MAKRNPPCFVYHQRVWPGHAAGSSRKCWKILKPAHNLDKVSQLSQQNLWIGTQICATSEHFYGIFRPYPWDSPHRRWRIQKRITPYYLARFIDSGIMDARQILAGRNIDDLPDRARIFFKRMILPPKTLELAIETQRRGIDLDRILHELNSP